MSAWKSRLILEDTLKKLDDALMVTPDSIESRFDRAVILRELGRTDDAKRAYLELLALAPTHFGALINLGALAIETGFQTAGRTAYLETVKHHPDNPAGHVNLANAYAQNHEVQAAIRHFEIALRLDPDHAEAHQGLARLFSERGDEEMARAHRIKGYRNQPIKRLPYRGNDRPIALLVLASAAGGAVPIWHHLDDQVFLTTILYVDFYDVAQPLPVHDLVFNAVGDADLVQSSLDVAAKILRQSNARVINPPSAVMATGRAANSRRLANIPGMITPKMELLPRELLESPNASCLLVNRGFTFPLLLRSPGFHNGSFFTRVEHEQSLAEVVSKTPGQELMVIQFLDARSSDGRIRKYRVMMIDGQIYPLHVAISHNWKIHFVTAEMADDPENRAEDAAFLDNMPRVLGEKAMCALEKLRDALGLDYAGVDFSVNANGDVLLFEANATMVVQRPDADKKWDYRRESVQRILDAIRRMLSWDFHARQRPAWNCPNAVTPPYEI